MSTIVESKRKCAICGKEHVFEVVMSTYTNGSMDLDTRPPVIKRNNLKYEIQYCPECHYANRDIENLIDNFNKDVLKSQAYLTVANDVKIDTTAKAYLLAGHLYAMHKDYREAGILFLNAAWVFDDLSENDYAKRARIKAHKYLSIYVEDSEDINLAVLTVDLQRRVEDFSSAIETANQLIGYGVDSFLEKILKLEISLCNTKDASCHDVSEVE